MKPERLDEIEHENYEGRCIADNGSAYVYQAVRDLCAALRAAQSKVAAQAEEIARLTRELADIWAERTVS